MKRRGFVASAGISGVGLAVAGSVWSLLSTKDGEEYRDERVASLLDNSESIIPALNLVANFVLPDTDTPGAGSINVGGWMVLAAEHELEGCTLDQLNRFVGLLNQAQLLMTLDTSDQVQLLKLIDLHAFEKDNEEEISALWRKVKALILMGYYSSELGASEELRYQAVPGVFIPDEKIDPEKVRAWSSDWTGVRFS